MLTTLEKAVAWSQTKSMWPDKFGLSCCAMEMISIVDSRYDIARFGMEAFRASPRQADLLIVSGRVAHKMAAPLRQIYDQMLEPKWVIAMGACASSGGMFNNYPILQGVDKIVAGRHPRARLPAAAGGADGGDRPAAREGRWPACRPRTRSAGWRRADASRASPASSRRRRRTARRRSSSTRRALRRGVHATCATSTGFHFLSDVAADRLPRLGREGASPATSAPPSGRDLNAPGSQGLARVPAPKPKRFAMNYHLLAPRAGRAARARPGLARRRRAGRRASSRSGRPPTGTSARPGT